MTIDQIEKLSQASIEYEVRCGKAEHVQLKGFNIFFTVLDDYFGYSALVFKNGRHIYYANVYQSNYSSCEDNKVDLHKHYIDILDNRLFTEDEIMSPVKDYDDYLRKGNFVRNYWIMQYEYVSIFDTNGPQTKWHYNKMKYYCHPCMCKVDDASICAKANEMVTHLNCSYRKLVEVDDTVFRKMIAYELANHEAGYTGDYESALDACGLQMDNLSEKRQRIVLSETIKLMRQADEV